MEWTVLQRWTLALACILFTGCTVWENARRTVSIEPSEFYWKKDKRRSMALYSQWADRAWQEELQCWPDLIYRPDYGLGFRDGFVDYVWAGGTGEPPPVPPRRFWNVEYRSEEGHRRMEDWYAGYRHGAQVARDGGFRALATLRPSTSLTPAEERDRERGVPEEGSLPTSVPIESIESLPTPSQEPPTLEFNEPTEDAATPSPDVAPPAEARPPVDASIRKPKLPPVPRNLPPTVPRSSTPRPNQKSPDDNSRAEPAPQSVPASNETLGPIEHEAQLNPLSLPSGRFDVESGPAALNSASDDDAAAAPKSSTSLRFIRVPTVANEARHSGTAPASHSPDPGAEVRSTGPVRRTPEYSAIRLTVATSDDAPAAPRTSAAGESATPSPTTAAGRTSMTSTIKVYPGTNALRTPQPLPPADAPPRQ